MAAALRDILDDLHQLSRPDKLRAMRFLLDELARDTHAAPEASTFEIWSPYAADETAEAVLAMLREDERSASLP